MRAFAFRRNVCVVLGAAFAISACGDDSEIPSDPLTSGTLEVRLKDAPNVNAQFPYDSVQAVTVFVVRVDAKQSISDSTEAAGGANAPASNGWVTVAQPNQSYNLLSLQNGNGVMLGSGLLASAQYKSLRLVIDPSQSSMQLKNGLTMSGTSPLLFPSAARSAYLVSLATPVSVNAGSTSHVMIDFNVGSTWTPRGVPIMLSGFNFKSSLSASVSVK